MVQPIQKVWNPNTLQWEQIVPTKEEFDDLAGDGRTTETVKDNSDQISILSQDVSEHLSEDMPHITADGGYKWGARVNPDLSLTFLFEEVE